MNFPSQIFSNEINHGYRAAILKKNTFWMLLFYMALATYCYYEKMCRALCAAIISCLLKGDLRPKFRCPGHFPDRHFPDGHIPNRHFPDGHFPDGHFPDQTHPRRTFPQRTLPQTDTFFSISYSIVTYLPIVIFIYIVH